MGLKSPAILGNWVFPANPTTSQNPTSWEVPQVQLQHRPSAARAAGITEALSTVVMFTLERHVQGSMGFCRDVQAVMSGSIGLALDLGVRGLCMGSNCLNGGKISCKENKNNTVFILGCIGSPCTLQEYS